LIKEDNEYYWGKILESRDCLEKKKAMLEDLIKRELSVENIQSPLIKIKYFIQNIEDFKKKDITIFKDEKFYSWTFKIGICNIYSKK